MAEFLLCPSMQTHRALEAGADVKCSQEKQAATQLCQPLLQIRSMVGETSALKACPSNSDRCLHPPPAPKLSHQRDWRKECEKKERGRWRVREDRYGVAGELEDCGSKMKRNAEMKVRERMD